MRPALKELRYKLLLLFFSLSLALCLGELLVRIATPTKTLDVKLDLIYQPDSLLGWRHTSNLDLRLSTGERKTRFITDQNGFRVGEDTSAGDEGDVSILFIGDSFIEATTVENEETIPQVVRRELDKHYRLKVRVINDGVAGWSPRNYFIESKFIPQKADLVLVFLFLGNDVMGQVDTSFIPAQWVSMKKLRLPEKLNRDELFSAIIYPINNFLGAHSCLYMFFKMRLDIITTRLGITIETFPEIFLKHSRNSSCWQATARMFKYIKENFDRKNIPALFVFLPTTYQVDESLYRKHLKMFNINPETVDLEQPNECLAQAFENEGIGFLDPLEFMRRRSREGAKLFGDYDRHLNREGQSCVAEFIIPYIAETDSTFSER